MKRIIASILVTSMLAAGLAGCTANQTAPSGSSGQESVSADPAGTGTDHSGATVTLRMTLWDKSNTQYAQPLIDAYEARNPDVKIEVMDISSAEYQDKISVMLSGGDDCDIITIKDIPGYTALITKSQLEPLDSYVDAAALDLSVYSGVTDELTYEDNLYSIPFRNDFWILYYNKDIFDEAGVEYPSNDMTWEEYETVARTLTSGEGAGKVYGTYHHFWRSVTQLPAVQDGKNSIISEDYTFLTDRYEMICKMQDDGITMDFGEIKAGNIHYSGVFFNEQTAMMPMGSWFIGTLIAKIKEGEADMNWGIVKLPHMTGVEPGTTAGNLTALAINKNSKNKEEAWKFMEFYCGPEGAKVLADTGAMPAIRDEAVIDIISSMDGFPADSNSKGALETATIRLELPIHNRVTMIDQVLSEEHELIMTKSSSIEEGIANMNKRVGELLQQ